MTVFQNVSGLKPKSSGMEDISILTKNV